MPQTETAQPATDGVQIAPHVFLYSDRIEVSLSFLAEIKDPERRAAQRELFCTSIARIAQSAEYVARTTNSTAAWEAGTPS